MMLEDALEVANRLRAPGMHNVTIKEMERAIFRLSEEVEKLQSALQVANSKAFLNKPGIDPRQLQPRVYELPGGCRLAVD